MKRSEINAIMREADAFIRKQGFFLPPFAYWTPQEWTQKGEDVREIAANAMGWDITDFGKGDFAKFGLFLFTIRNGSPENLKTGKGKVYAEKLIVIREQQVTPMHFHWSKTEDIINRGGGNLVFRLFNATKTGRQSGTDVEVSQDGRRYVAKAGSDIVLKPGESITLDPYCYHEFFVQPGTGAVLLGEVSMCNDDNADNRFLENLGRFPTIEEDEPPYRLLCTEYPKAKKSR